MHLTDKFDRPMFSRS